jgi:hypothetical protein
MLSRMPTTAGTTTLRLDYTKWGEKVTIEAPSKANITDDSLLNRIGEFAGSETP